MGQRIYKEEEKIIATFKRAFKHYDFQRSCIFWHQFIWLSVNVLYNTFARMKNHKTSLADDQNRWILSERKKIVLYHKQVTILTIPEWMKLDNRSGPQSCSEKAHFLATKERKVKCWLLKGWKVKSAPDFHLISGFWHSSREASRTAEKQQQHQQQRQTAESKFFAGS